MQTPAWARLQLTLTTCAQPIAGEPPVTPVPSAPQLCARIRSAPASHLRGLARPVAPERIIATPVLPSLLRRPVATTLQIGPSAERSSAPRRAIPLQQPQKGPPSLTLPPCLAPTRLRPVCRPRAPAQLLAPERIIATPVLPSLLRRPVATTLQIGLSAERSSAPPRPIPSRPPQIGPPSPTSLPCRAPTRLRPVCRPRAPAQLLAPERTIATQVLPSPLLRPMVTTLQIGL